MWAAKRNPDVKDESIWDFVARRFGADIADTIVDPVIKGFICDNSLIIYWFINKTFYRGLCW